jgi:hypothetical protein
MGSGMAAPDETPLLIDGSHGEGGGQILRTALSLSAMTGRPLRIERIRTNRRNPGLAAQHVTAVRAAAALCGARVAGDRLASQEMDFVPTAPVAAGDYVFDVALAREGGSAGAVSLVLQTVLLPLALTAGKSSVTVRGGTHLPLFEKRNPGGVRPQPRVSSARRKCGGDRQSLLRARGASRVGLAPSSDGIVKWNSGTWCRR